MLHDYGKNACTKKISHVKNHVLRICCKEIKYICIHHDNNNIIMKRTQFVEWRNENTQKKFGDSLDLQTSFN